MSFDPEKMKQRAELAAEFQDKLIARQYWQTCLNCVQWDELTETCIQFNARPPAPIIVNGCRDYQSDIPF